ncbi:hypothetical protein Bbelb_146900 [Branchiostoma belcheri]|nr:hypothetical protein Bbelb_146900 [Branchiostoma belcheri]
MGYCAGDMSCLKERGYQLCFVLGLGGGSLGGKLSDVGKRKLFMAWQFLIPLAVIDGLWEEEGRRGQWGVGTRLSLGSNDIKHDCQRVRGSEVTGLRHTGENLEGGLQDTVDFTAAQHDHRADYSQPEFNGGSNQCVSSLEQFPPMCRPETVLISAFHIGSRKLDREASPSRSPAVQAVHINSLDKEMKRLGKGQAGSVGLDSAVNLQ